MTEAQDLQDDLERIRERSAQLRTLREHWEGRPPTAFLSTKAREQLDDRLPRLSVNFPRLLVSSYVDRMNLSGFRLSNGDPAPKAWDRHRRCGLQGRADLVHTDRLMYGAAYVTVWPEATGPAVVLDSPFTMTVDSDPLTGTVHRATRTWVHKRARHALVIEPDRITRWRADGTDADAGGQWEHVTGPELSPWGADGIVPVVPFIRRMSSDDHQGTSVAADVLDLTDAENKLMGDAMVTSEAYARPRRWATGLEIQEDEDGNPIDPFARDRSLQSEDPDTKFGQFDPARLDSYADMSATITQLIGAMTGLPAHYLGLHGDQPANADSVRAAEAQLTLRVLSELEQMNGPWGQVATLVDLAANLDVTVPSEYIPEWRSPATRAPAVDSDSATKLHSIGVPLPMVMAETMGWSPDLVGQLPRE